MFRLLESFLSGNYIASSSLATILMIVLIVAVSESLSSAPALKEIEHLYNLRGSKDLVYKFTKLFFPRQWLFIRGTNWERLLREGRFTDLVIGPVSHIGKNSYMDETGNAQKVVNLIAKIIQSYT